VADPRPILELAAQMDPRIVDKLAHALGWPDSGGYKATRGPTRWADPYRNHYVTAPTDPDMCEAVRRGLAEQRQTGVPLGRNVCFVVTPLGRKVVRLCHEARRAVP
jgi:hypothetical protein